MKQEDNHSPSKANSTTKIPNTHIEGEASNNEFQKATAKIVNNLKKRNTKVNT
jgi:hypothetical protein